MEFRDEEEERTRFRFRFQQIPSSSRPNTFDFNGCPNPFDFDTLSASNSFDFAFHASNPTDFAVQDSQIAWGVSLKKRLRLINKDARGVC
ncbi:hypothetical protein QL285_089512 [Trifolium repens]|nr:hypothetical protein QL285_089512 [Trifolium repens]